MNLEEKLQYLQTASMEEARLEGNEIINKYKQKLDELYDEYEKERLEQVKLTIKAETANVEHTINKALAKEQLKVKKKLTKRSNELKKQLFEEVRQLLLEYKETDAYDQLLISKIKKAKAFANGSEIEIYIDKSDAAKQAQLEKAAAAEIRISEEDFFGGIRAVLPSRNILIEESFASQLKEACEKFSFFGGVNHE